MLSIQIASDLEHENVVAEINHQDKFLCLLSMEQSDDVPMIEFPIELPTTGRNSFVKVQLDAFIKIANRAKEQLLEGRN